MRLPCPSSQTLGGGAFDGGLSGWLTSGAGHDDANLETGGLSPCFDLSVFSESAGFSVDSVEAEL